MNQNHLRVFSQDIQLTGGGDRVKWVGGLYYWNQGNYTRSTRYQVEEFVSGLYNINTAYANPICTSVHHADPHPPAFGTLSDCQDVYAAASGPGGRFDALTHYTQDGWAAYGEATISLTKKIDMTVGMRHHDQNDDATPLTIVPGATAPRAPLANQRFVGDVFNGSSVGQVSTPSSFDKNTYRFSVQDQFTQDVMAYIGYSEGFNSGGASVYTDPSTAQRVVAPYDPQFLKNTEIGIRSDLANKHLRINATIFHTQWDDIQSLAAVFDSRGAPASDLDEPERRQRVGQGRRARDDDRADREVAVQRQHRLPRRHVHGDQPGHVRARHEHGVRASAEAHGQRRHPVQREPEQGIVAHRRGSTTCTKASSGGRCRSCVRRSGRAVPAGFDESGGQGIVNLRMAYKPGDGELEPRGVRHEPHGRAPDQLGLLPRHLGLRLRDRGTSA